MGNTIARVLIVDDESELNDTLCHTLAEHDFGVVGVSSGHEALAALREQSFDLLLTDLMMPGMDGIEVLRQALEIDPHLVGIVMTGHGTVQTAVSAMKSGAFDYVLKPFKLQTLLPVLHRALDVSRLRRENLQLRGTVAMHEFTQALASTLDLDTILNKVADAAVQQLGADEASIMLPSQSGEEFVIQVVRGENRQHMLGESVPREHGIAGWVAQNHEAVVLHGRVEDNRFAALANRPDVVSSISMPMLAGGKTVGILNINATSRRRPFAAGEVQALHILATTTGHAIAGARQYQQAREAEKKYRSIFENSVEGIFQSTPDGKYISANPALARILKFGSPEELVNTDGEAEHLLIGFDRRKEFLQQLEARDAILGFETTVQLNDGSTTWVSVSARAVRDESGSLLFYEGNVEDISERKQAETALLASREELQRAHDDLDLRVRERTDELARTNAELRARETQLLEGNRVFAELTRLRVTTAEELNTVLHTISEACGRVLGTDRCSLWLFNEGHSAIECIDLYEASTGQHSKDAILHAAQFPGYFKALESGRIIAAEDAHTHPATAEFSEPYLTPLGITSMLDVAILKEGELAGVLCCEQVGNKRHWALEDQTFASSASAICSLALESYERASAEESLRYAKEEAERANRAKSDFLSRMSHELRTPLNGILGFGQVLEMQNLTPLQSESVEHILKAGHHLLQLVNEVLNIARIEAGRMELSIEPVPVNDVITESLSLVQPLAVQANIHLPEHPQDGPQIYVLADRQRLKQVLINLLSNAVKYNQLNGSVQITTHLQELDSVRIAVEDTGIGIPPGDLDKLFTPFERLAAERTTIEGSGLGLTLSKRLVEAMNGTIEVESVQGEGTTFTLLLPSAESPALSLENLPPEPYREEPPEGSRQLQTVLSIEDNSANHRLIQAILAKRENIELLGAMQGSIGLDIARQHRPELILLDLHLPDIPGVEVLARLRQTPETQHIPIVVLSADATPMQIERLLKAGANAYLTKPINIKELLRVVDETLALGGTENVQLAHI